MQPSLFFSHEGDQCRVRGYMNFVEQLRDLLQHWRMPSHFALRDIPPTNVYPVGCTLQQMQRPSCPMLRFVDILASVGGYCCGARSVSSCRCIVTPNTKFNLPCAF